MKRTRIFAAIIAVPFIWFIFACGDRRFGGITPDDGSQASQSTNYISLHNSSSSQYRGDCLSCHSDILEEGSLNPNIKAAHQAMIGHTPGASTEDKCVYCHASVDILQHSAGNIRKNVSAATCDVCHGPGGTGTQYYQK